jgi:two-component system NtrC family sensor kinase
MASGEVARCEAQAVRRDGSTFWLGFHTAPLRNRDGRITHYVTVGADITARIEADLRKTELQEQLYGEMRERERIAIELRLAQKLESVGRLAAGMAHEINTPIQYVGDSVYFLRSAFEDLSKLFSLAHKAARQLAERVGDQEVLGTLDACEQAIDFDFVRQEVPKAFERTLEGVERVGGIVRAMKEFAHPDATEHSPADINHALETTLTVARAEYKYTATVETRFGVLPAVVCNVGELNQVFLNLIVNAAHAIHDSGKDVASGRIIIETETSEGWALIAITDNGCGIAQENIDKIFDPFFTTKEVGRGTGQGLAIARAIVVDKHGGQLDVTSEPGAGTRFTLKLPVAGRAKVSP